MILYFNGFDVRFTYDSENIQPSKLDTNEVTDESNEYFEFENEFQNYLEFLTIDDGENTVRAIISYSPPYPENYTDHLKYQDDIGYVIDTTKDVLLGKMSFNMTGETFDPEWFKLKKDEISSPQTGIKINIGNNKNYQEQSTFRFTDQTASKDASLIDLKLTKGKEGEEDFTQFTLNPEFVPQTTDYELELLDYIDTVNVTATVNDKNSTLKMKVPQRDNDKRIFEGEGTDIDNIKYVELENVESGQPTEVTLNKLGEPDTKITIIVTAEDGITTMEYNLVIHRPYAKIKGSIITPPTTKTEGDSIYKANIKIYDASVVSNAIDWNEYLDFNGEGDDLHSLLTELNCLENETNDDGTYEIYVIPGTYDIMIDKAAYLDCIYISNTLLEYDELDLGSKMLIVGDLNKDGIVSVSDYSIIYNIYDASYPDEKYIKNQDYDFDGDSVIGVSEASYIYNNYLRIREIID